MTKSELKANLPEGWTFHENNGRVHIKDANKNFRIRIDPPDKKTPYQHMHIYDEKGKPLDINGNVVDKKSPDGHIPWDKQ
ncbi:transposase [Virgibacillus dakarensis]|nr:transposase [Virgibacillus dakarensis]